MFPSIPCNILSRKVYIAQNCPFFFIFKFPGTAASSSIFFALLFWGFFRGWVGAHCQNIFADSERTTASNRLLRQTDTRGTRYSQLPHSKALKAQPSPYRVANNEPKFHIVLYFPPPSQGRHAHMA